ncbi:peptidase M29, aminopeptidase II [Alkaliphilus metalliredigens QYMF]|uniref:Peptidase M29, aminopeptidase II n=1 Tax=Alkaliphilus metalliredigens (strain QYMF) TaxID=293826 RepID=A6TVW3_ALKMQ|nr:aminopeptidase [Alkaliphilus metalliredigens]ABR50331.1 peptidase M29, aminopeptidase II [Alkaliphilus metalliredigens QYMF]
MEDFQNNLMKYADLAVRIGVNLQAGQTLVINAPIESADFVRIVAERAYAAGAKNVHVEWGDELMTLLKLTHAPEEGLEDFPIWKATGFEEMAQGGAAFLSISAANPDLLKDADPQRVATMNKYRGQVLEKFKTYTQSGKVCWSIIATPTPEWAAKVFPEVAEEKQVETLWNSIFKATRVITDDPVKAWSTHIENLKSKLQYLNRKKYKMLHFKGSGTDLRIELPEGHVWIGGGLSNDQGRYFVPNLPTEEVFTMPLKEGINGIVQSTKPLSYGGNLLENFTLTFEKGRIVDFTAEKGYATLQKLIDTDEGSHYLGEIALVPHDSPISNTNIIFYNTLFDENASSHLAIGSAYPLCIKDGGKMNKDQLEAHGANTSLTHVDFMIGSPGIDVDGETANGDREAIFRAGNWVI